MKIKCKIIRANHKFADLSPVHFSVLSNSTLTKWLPLEASSVLSNAVASLKRFSAAPFLQYFSHEKSEERDINDCHRTTEAISTSWKCQWYRYIHNLRSQQQQSVTRRRKQVHSANNSLFFPFYFLFAMPHVCMCPFFMMVFSQMS